VAEHGSGVTQWRIGSGGVEASEGGKKKGTCFDKDELWPETVNKGEGEGVARG